MEEACTCQTFEVHRWKPNMCASCLHRKHTGACQWPTDQTPPTPTTGKRALPNIPPQTITPPTPSTEHETSHPTTTPTNSRFERNTQQDKQPSLDKLTTNKTNEKPHTVERTTTPPDKLASTEKTTLTPQQAPPTNEQNSQEKHLPPPVEKRSLASTEKTTLTPQALPTNEQNSLEKHLPPSVEKRITNTRPTHSSSTPIPLSAKTTENITGTTKPPENNANVSTANNLKSSDPISTTPNTSSNTSNAAINTSNGVTKSPSSPSGRLINMSITATLSFSNTQPQTVIEPPTIVEPESGTISIKENEKDKAPRNGNNSSLSVTPTERQTRHQKSNSIGGMATGFVTPANTNQKNSRSFLANARPGESTPRPNVNNNSNTNSNDTINIPDADPFASIFSADSSSMDPTNVYMRIMLRLVKVMALQLDDKIVKDFLSKAELESRIRNRPVPIYRYWTSSTGNSGITNIMNECQYFLNFENDIQKIVKVQSIVRGHLGRKRFAQLQKYFVNPYKERNHILSDLIKNENQYLDKLNLMIKSYLTPLRAQLQKGSSLLSSAPILSTEDLRCIFSNIEIIRGVHEGLLRDMQNLASDWPAIESIGESILRKAPDLKVYGEYVTNIKAALDTFNRVYETNPRFVQFLDERQVENHMDPGLMALMSVPLNQISQYSFQLSRLVKATPSSLSDHDSLLSASVIMGESYNLITQAMNQSSERALLLDVQRRLVPGYVPPELDLFSLRAPPNFQMRGQFTSCT
eukprot:TRINITY_DN3773_c0_g2_i1.p1 TRINITY_DN3773_c0_g2~~TRINITY_DN3773_c0_g2_i1.p1  ORF type:complete len:751 (-),score=149.20 TRINITY_DN3773_c0_g2_i1:995-3247(-)